MTQAYARQLDSSGDSCPDLHVAALVASLPLPQLTWLDIGCGTGAVLRHVLQYHDPVTLSGVDLIDWLDTDLRGHVKLIVGPAEQVVAEGGPVGVAERVLLLETLEHLEAPWLVLRGAARSVAPGGRIVVSTPNVANLRHRLELLLRGTLTAFRPANLPHMTPALPHVIERVLREEGMRPSEPSFAGRDVIPWTNGRRWPGFLHSRFSRATAVSVLIAADREPEGKA